ncbi:uncharacterized protein LOC123037966 [Drosophila rhopaloa]|uniref:Uncharacterized protein n=1 Tax=Drosophila rhopaloa TaxID=1041015 RepID=A0ABM5JDQ0_DRORH|nr:uncharacterized protein LOC123037966 [Drosophila rhopaloa]
MGRSDTYFYPTSSEEYESDAPQTDRGCDMGGRKRKATPRVKTQRASAKHKPMSVEKRKRFVKLKKSCEGQGDDLCEAKEGGLCEAKEGGCKAQEGGLCKAKEGGCKAQEGGLCKAQEEVTYSYRILINISCFVA